MSYRKLYESVYGEIEEGWDVHHIDWNHHNDVIENLVAIPPKVHQLIHNYLGYVTKEEALLLTDKFFSNKNYKNKSISYLNFKLSKYVDTDKSSELAILCKERVGEKADRYYKMIKGGYREEYKDGVKLYKSVGQTELDLIKETGTFPPRLKGQKMFYPTLNYGYAARLGEQWTVNHELSCGVSYLIEFTVNGLYFLKQKVHNVGGLDQELWIPADKLSDLNDNITHLKVIDKYELGMETISDKIPRKRMELEREINTLIVKLCEVADFKARKLHIDDEVKDYRKRITEARKELKDLG